MAFNKLEIYILQNKEQMSKIFQIRRRRVVSIPISVLITTRKLGLMITKLLMRSNSYYRIFRNLGKQTFGPAKQRKSPWVWRFKEFKPIYLDLKDPWWNYVVKLLAAIRTKYQPCKSDWGGYQFENQNRVGWWV